MRSTGFTRASTLGPIAEVIKASGGSAERVFSRSNLPIALLQTPEVFVPLKDHFNLLQQSASELSDELFAPRLGQMITIRDLGVYGKWIRQASTLLGAIWNANKSIGHLLQSATSLNLDIVGERAVWSYNSHDSAVEGRQQNEMLALCFMIEIARTYLGSQWLPERIIVGGKSVSDINGLSEVFGTETSFHDGPGTIIFDRRSLATILTGTDRQALMSNDFGQSIDVPKSDSLVDTVRALISLELTERLPSISWVAGKLSMTERTLQRQLVASGYRFSRMAQTIVHQRAATLLNDNNRSITEVAVTLGYSDAAHFSRAFRRLTGMSPQHWREINSPRDDDSRTS